MFFCCFFYRLPGFGPCSLLWSDGGAGGQHWSQEWPCPPHGPCLCHHISFSSTSRYDCSHTISCPVLSFKSITCFYILLIFLSSLSEQLQQQLHLLAVPMVVWVVELMVPSVPWLPSSLSSRVDQGVLWAEAPSTGLLPSTALPRAPHFFRKVLASRDQGLPPWASASPPLPPLVPHWGPHWEDLAQQVNFININFYKH